MVSYSEICNMVEQERPKAVFKKKNTKTNQKQDPKPTQSFGLALLSQKSVGSRVSKHRAMSWESSLENIPPVIHAEFQKDVWW